MSVRSTKLEINFIGEVFSETLFEELVMSLTKLISPLAIKQAGTKVGLVTGIFKFFPCSFKNQMKSVISNRILM